MALDANAYKRAAASTDGVVPEVYDERVIEHLYNAEKLRPLADDVSSYLLGKAGKTITFFTETQFSASTLTEGTDTPISALDYANFDLTLAWFGDAKQISMETLSENFDFVWDRVRIGAAGALAENRDVQIMTELLNSTSDAIYPISTGTTRYTDANIIAGAGDMYEQAVKCKVEMAKDNLNMSYLVISPDQSYKLYNDAKFYTNSTSEMDVIKNGVIGKYLGFKVIESNNVQITDEGAADAIEVSNAIALSDKAFYYAQKLTPVMEFERETKRQRAWTFHYFEAFGVKIKRNEGVIVMKTA